MTDDRPTVDRPTEGQWLTYSDAAHLFGISTEALRSLARRHGWNRRSPNAIGSQAWVQVPADRLPINGRDNRDHRSATDGDRQQLTVQPAQTNGRDDTDQRLDPESDRNEDRRSKAILTAVRDMAETLMGPVREQIVDLKMQLTTERERADRAEGRAQEAEDRARALAEQRGRAGDQNCGNRAELQAKEAEQRAQAAESRARDLQEQLTAEMTEHRRVVGLLTEQLAERRSWWPWRRRA